MSRDPLSRDLYSHRGNAAADFDSDDDANDDAANDHAVNDHYYGRSRSSKSDTLRARRRVEALLEERRLRRAIDDDWSDEEE
ncbi:PA3496 family putative envelope integrity protein [Vreelandella massiliensis]|uniref:PA3496 family putative envelope integrity protein n=1 Tax=Vreelandella massiliensis TaxID=1816686 RepID=UPI00096A42E6|nr:hypothetical protein [Halomonas massiliensis]MYL23135.1 hypothetical protein [Halomonas alkaliantarctica]